MMIVAVVTVPHLALLAKIAVKIVAVEIFINDLDISIDMKNFFHPLFGGHGFYVYGHTVSEWAGSDAEARVRTRENQGLRKNGVGCQVSGKNLREEPDEEMDRGGEEAEEEEGVLDFVNVFHRYYLVLT